jgi:arylsulfatase A-like enzyme
LVVSGCSRREFLGAAGVGAATAALGAAAVAASASAAPAGGARRPNLVYVFADQLGYQHCGYTGNPKARTPRLDALAREGTSFRQMVVNQPVCSAYRATLMTGLYTTSHGLVINELRLRTDHDCLGHGLTRAGYQTAYIGKWHLYANELGNHFDPKNSFVPRGPNRLGFDGLWAAYNFHHENYGTYYHTESPEKVFYGQGVYEPDAQTGLAIDWLRQARRDQPFAMFLSWGPPHDPWNDGNTPEAARRQFEGVEFPNPPNYRDENDPYADDGGRLKPGERRQLEAWRRNYYAQTTSLDDNLGRLLDALDAAGLRDDTIVIFTSDHGEMFGAHGRRAKNIFYEEAARVPFVVRWPSHVPAGATRDTLLSAVDLQPTLLSLLGLPVPKAAEGQDLSHRFLGQPGPEPEAVLMQGTGAVAAWQDGFEWRALRDARYTYAVYRRDRSELLFDHQADPHQLRNLVDDPAHRDALERLRRGLRERMEAIDDGFEACTWYRDHWTKDRIIQRGARG